MLQHSHFRIDTGVGIVYKNVSFYLQSVSVNMLANIFGSLYFAIVLRC